MLKLDAYGLGWLQELQSLLDTAEGMELTELHREVAAHVAKHIAAQATPSAGRQQVRQRSRQRPPAGRVPCGRGCGGTLDLYPVNISRCTNVGGPWRTQAICGRCGRDQYSELTIAEIRTRGSL